MLFVGARRCLFGGARNPLVALIASMFGAGEQGAVYDPSDLSSMWQEAAGSTPAVVDSPVGLILDKRLGMVRGADVVVNGAFASDTGWNKTDPGATIAGGALVFTAVASTFGANQSTLMSGLWYEITFDVTEYTAGAVSLKSTGGTTSDIFRSAVGSYREIVFAANTLLAFQARGVSTLKIDNVVARPIAGNHALQATSASRPMLRFASGKYYLEFDGFDDSLATAAINFTATDKMTVFAGVYKASDAATGIVVELSAISNTNDGSFKIGAPDPGGTNTLSSSSRGTAVNAANQGAASSGLVAPLACVVSSTHDISGDLTTLRVNQVAATSATGDKGAGNFGTYPLYVGRRGSTTLPFYGRVYFLAIRGAASSAAQITAGETVANAKTGAF